MEKAKWRIRLCLIIVVLVAVTVGLIYYWQNLRPVEISEGVLISIIGEVEDGNGSK